MPTVLNARGTGWSADTLPEGSVYVGRSTWPIRMRSKWSNPFTIPRDATHEERLEAIARYRAWLLRQPELMAALPELRGKDLVCWCAPKPCHGAVLLELANA